MTEKTCNRRARRVRYALQQANCRGLHRCCVKRTSQHIYCQVIDDRVGRTVAACSTIQKAFTGTSSRNRAAATMIGVMIAEKVQALGINDMVLDRGMHRYHKGGVLDVFATAIRAAGIKI